MKRILPGVLLMVLAYEPAMAHAFLIHASPGAGSVLARAPANVTLDFSEQLEPAFSTIVVTDNAGHSVAASPSTAEGTRMAVPLKRLAAGTFHVTWQALSIDTHKTQGNFIFTIRP